ncbi:PREDICTED: protein HASTY 1 [Tarenaya hassleriana]|uniref:protein HASTY 1 n=1 Tax=Tarenaya hassleriana TaxID=28532 RepID=UPI00053C90E4|nr:PREDICTED: protein HASTY 1 [Tarenaya hassleriana]
MDDSNGGNITASNVARAILAVLDYNSTPDARKAAVAFLESIKSGDIRVLASISFLLVKKDWSSEIRLHAFKMLQHLVRLRWELLSPQERRNFANVSVELMSEVANPCEEWPLKSQTAALVAEIVRREGPNLWQELFPSLASLSTQGPLQAELVAMMLRWLPEDITVHNEDLEGDRRRLLLRGLTQSLPEILPLLYNLLESHFGAAMNEANRQQVDLAKQHAAAVIACLNAINAYAEWAPVPDLASYGIVNGCGFLLSSPDFRLHACEFFKLVCSRKRPSDASGAEYDSAISSVFQILMNVSREFLHQSASNAGVIDDSGYEFAECICESLVSLGSMSLQCIATDSNALALYLQQMLGYFQHFKLGLHFEALLFWVALLRDLLSKPKASANPSGDGSAVGDGDSSGQTNNEKKKILSLINDDISSSILDVSFQRMLKKEKVPPGIVPSLGPLELWSDEFEGKGDFGQYRSRLLELVKLISSHKPLIASTKISERVVMLIRNLLVSPAPLQDLAVLDGQQLALECIVGVVFDGLNEFAGGSAEVHFALRGIFEGLLQQLLTLKWTEPELIKVLGHYLDAMGPFLKYFPDAVGSVINKLFELLTCLPHIVKDPATSTARIARLQICTSFIRIAKAADKSILPHMKGIADTMGYLQREGTLLRGEHNILGEAFLVMASAAGPQQQQEILVWLLEPLSQQWIQSEWQNNYLSDPMGLVRLCSNTPFMWSIFHTVTFFEKALKRSGYRKGNSNTPTSTSPALHPMASHLSWMLPPLIKLLRVIHYIWSPSVYQTLPTEIRAAMTMTDVERRSLLGEANPKLPKGSSIYVDGSLDKEGNPEVNESDIRNWLKGIRDSGYYVLGLSATIGDTFFKCLDPNYVAVALMENLQSMEFRHIRQLIHSFVVHLVKSCPADMWESWLEILLHPLFVHCQQAVSSSWSGLLHEGRAKVPDSFGVQSGPDLKLEVMEEKLLRDLTREIGSLLSIMASPGLNNGLPVLEQSGHVGSVDMSCLKDLHAFRSNSMVGFLLNHKNVALPALQICLEVFTWTDGETTTKVCCFCGVVVHLAILTDNVELREFVSKDLFSAVIRGLAMESNAVNSADLVNLCREIFIYLSDRDPSPRQVLMSLPCLSEKDMKAFEEAVGKTSSPKEQKQLMRSLLLVASGSNLRALSAQKSLNVITNVTSRTRSASSETKEDEGDTIGLASVL